MNILIAAFLLMTTLSHASAHHGGGEGGDRVGNGGDIVVCTQLAGEVIYILEEYDTTRSTDLGSTDLNYKQKMNILLNRIKKYFPERYDFYVSALEYFERNVTFLKPSLPEINDARESVGYSCEITQAAYFKKDKEGNFKYFIQKSLWNHLSEDQKAILVMHELLYTEAASLGHKTSYYIRKINILLFTNAVITPNTIDELFLKPIRDTEFNIKLENIYSPAIAGHVLHKDLSAYYADKDFKKNLTILKKRFSKHPQILRLIHSHLERI